MSHDTCVIDACDKPVLNKKRGMCSVHYQRWRKWGDPHKAPVEKKCTVEGCDNKHAAKGMCAPHYMRVKNHGHTELIGRFKPMIPCSVEGCTELVKSGMCKMHYGRVRRHGDPHTFTRVRLRAVDVPETCTLENCNDEYWAKGKCRVHYAHDRHLAEREAKNARCREHYEANKLVYNVKASRRKRNMTDGMTKEDLDISFEYRKAIMNDPCSYCGAPGEETDHIFPVNLGGKDHWWNLTRACKDCNRRKAAHCGTYYILKSGRAVDYIPPLVA
jgi:5-methylcytosine-specific restriction endonuclease McrA